VRWYTLAGFLRLKLEKQFCAVRRRLERNCAPAACGLSPHVGISKGEHDFDAMGPAKQQRAGTFWEQRTTGGSSAGAVDWCGGSEGSRH